MNRVRSASGSGSAASRKPRAGLESFGLGSWKALVDSWMGGGHTYTGSSRSRYSAKTGLYPSFQFFGTATSRAVEEKSMQFQVPDIFIHNYQTHVLRERVSKREGERERDSERTYTHTHTHRDTPTNKNT